MWNFSVYISYFVIWTFYLFLSRRNHSTLHLANIVSLPFCIFQTVFTLFHTAPLGRKTSGYEQSGQIQRSGGSWKLEPQHLHSFIVLRVHQAAVLYMWTLSSILEVCRGGVGVQILSLTHWVIHSFNKYLSNTCQASRDYNQRGNKTLTTRQSPILARSPNR